MAKNSNLHNAKVSKNDDFFTQLSDIEIELGHYWAHDVNHFEGKSVLMNCDNPKFSNFWVYFHKNFSKLKLKRIGAVYYSTSEPVYYKEYTGGDDFDITVGTETQLSGNGDFRSEECIEILKGYDMVVTNPPFSLWRDVLAQIIKYDKEYILIGNMNAVTCKEVFPLIKDNKMWYGASIHSGDRKFGVPDSYPLEAAGCGIDEDGQRYIRVKGVRWFTNVDYVDRHEYLVLSKEYTPDAYLKYENYDAINVDKTKDIPVDYFESYVIDIENKSRLTDYHIYDDIYEFLDAVKYKDLSSNKIAIEHKGKLIIPVVKDNANEVNALLISKGIIGAEYRNGIMGVPITFLDKYCSKQFEIIGMDNDLTKDKKRGIIKGKRLYARIIVKLIINIDTENKEIQRDRIRNNDEDTRQKADKLSNDLLNILSLPGAIKQGLTCLRVEENE